MDLTRSMLPTGAEAVPAVRRHFHLRLLLLFLFSAFFLSRTYKYTVTLYSLGDDDYYWSYGRSLVYDGDLDFSNEPLPTFHLQNEVINFASPFPGLIWSPAVLAGRLMSPLIRHLPEVTADALQTGTTPYHRLLVSAFSASLTLLGMLLLFESLSRFVSPWAAFAGTVVPLLGTPLFYYTFRRPLMTHSSEFLSLAALVWISLRWLEKPTVKMVFTTGLIAAIAVGIRYPNVFVVAGWLFICSLDCRFWAALKNRGWLWFGAGLALPVVAQLVIWKFIWGAWTPQMTAYSFGGGDLLHHLRLSLDTLHGLVRVGVGPGWGLLWLETPVVLAFWATFKFPGTEGRLMRLLFLGAIPILLLTANYGTQGGSYAYRYCLAKVLWLSFGVAFFMDHYRQKKWTWSLFLLSLLPPLVCLLLFESGPEALTLQFGREWMNESFAANVLKTLLHDPKQLLFGWSGTPLIHLLLVVLAKTSLFAKLPAAIVAKVSERLQTIPTAALFWYLFWLLSWSVLESVCFSRFLNHSSSTSKGNR